MSFILFILLLAVAMIVVPLITAFIKIYTRVRRYGDMFRGFTSGSTFGAEEESRTRRGGWTYPVKRKKKVFARNEGEYVDFKEVKLTETATYSEYSDGSGRSCRYVNEQRITDAEWEEII